MKIIIKLKYFYVSFKNVIFYQLIIYNQYKIKMKICPGVKKYSRTHEHYFKIKKLGDDIKSLCGKIIIDENSYDEISFSHYGRYIGDYLLTDTLSEQRRMCRSCNKISSSYKPYFIDDIEELDNLEETEKYKKHRELIEKILKDEEEEKQVDMKKKIEHENYFNNVIKEMYKDKSKKCLICLSEIPKDEFRLLSCGHCLDEECCKVITEDDQVKCPLCLHITTRYI